MIQSAMGNPDRWDPARYGRFEDERARPFHELVELVTPRPRMRVVDLGCGTGELTRVMHRRLEARFTIGLDASRNMLARRPREDDGALLYVCSTIEEPPLAGPFDLLLSNAALHWVEDHARVLASWRGLLAAGGQIAVQVPANHEELPHRTAAEVAREEPFASAMEGYERRVPVLSPQGYARLLDQLGYREPRVWLRVYAHRFPSRDSVVEWVRGTLLLDYLKRLPDELGTAFVERYRERLVPELADRRPFFFPFSRILLHAFWEPAGA